MTEEIMNSFQEASLKNSLSKSFNSESYNVSNEGKIHKNISKRSKKSAEDNDNDDGEDRSKRDNMNEKIQELLKLIPLEYFINKDRSSGTKDGKPNKGQILTKGVEYIQDLQNKIDDNNRKEVELIWKLKKLCNSNSLDLPSNNEINLNNTSAEIVLSEIGVGPLAGTTAPTPAQATRVKAPESPNNNFEYGGYDQYS